MLIVNFKNYEKATGEGAAEMASQVNKAAEETGERIIVSTTAPDLLRGEERDIEVFSQHVDTESFGSHTGSVLPEVVKEAGASGTLISHSEQRIPDKVDEAVGRAKEAGLTTIVCAQSPEECEKFTEFEPDYIAYEPPELIGGDVSVSSAKPELIEEAVEKSGDVATLTGAGIKSREDVEKSIELGCEGVLVASGIVKAENPEEAVKGLAEGL